MVYSYCPTPRPTNMCCIELCGGVHIAQRQVPMQIPIGFCVHVIGICVRQGECIITTSPLCSVS